MKTIARILSIFLVISVVGAGSALAVPFGDGGAALQGVLDGITVGGPSSVNAATDEVADAYDSTWQITASGGSVATLIIELAGFADGNTFGVYSNGQYVELFAGSDGAGDQAVLSIKADGSVYVNFSDTGIDFTGNNFGYYLDSTANTGGGLWHSDTSMNADGTDHMAAYQGLDVDTVQLPGLSAGIWADNEYVLAFEDLDNSTGSADRDYTDFVVMVESVKPVPEPATMFLLGTGLIGLAGIGRKKMIKS